MLESDKTASWVVDAEARANRNKVWHTTEQ